MRQVAAGVGAPPSLAPPQSAQHPLTSSHVGTAQQTTCSPEAGVSEGSGDNSSYECEISLDHMHMIACLDYPDGVYSQYRTSSAVQTAQ